MISKNGEAKKCIGDPIADSLAVVTRRNSAILALADGVSWGSKSRLASTCSIYGSVKYLDQHLPYCKTTRDVFTEILKSFEYAQECIVALHGTMTTLCVGVVVQLNEKNRYGFCVVNVGDSYAYIYNKRYGVKEVTEGSHPLDQIRDMRNSGGALGPADGYNPDLSNLTCSFVILEEGDLVFLCSDGISDNFDPVISKKPFDQGIDCMSLSSSAESDLGTMSERQQKKKDNSKPKLRKQGTEESSFEDLSQEILPYVNCTACRSSKIMSEKSPNNIELQSDSLTRNHTVVGEDSKLNVIHNEQDSNSATDVRKNGSDGGGGKDGETPLNVKSTPQPTTTRTTVLHHDNQNRFKCKPGITETRIDGRLKTTTTTTTTKTTISRNENKEKTFVELPHESLKCFGFETTYHRKMPESMIIDRSVSDISVESSKNRISPKLHQNHNENTDDMVAAKNKRNSPDVFVEGGEETFEQITGSGEPTSKSNIKSNFPVFTAKTTNNDTIIFDNLQDIDTSNTSNKTMRRNPKIVLKKGSLDRSISLPEYESDNLNDNDRDETKPKSEQHKQTGFSVFCCKDCGHEVSRRTSVDEWALDKKSSLLDFTGNIGGTNGRTKKLSESASMDDIKNKDGKEGDLKIDSEKENRAKSSSFTEGKDSLSPASASSFDATVAKLNNASSVGHLTSQSSTDDLTNGGRAGRKDEAFCKNDHLSARQRRDGALHQMKKVRNIGLITSFPS